ncbi:MAG: hypothetical protein FWC01_03700 [Treponema sp.]|nr:hypothetical protein [Treponema sp.]MCL2237507.1 hypothetical protein [Treponema sp.]
MRRTAFLIFYFLLFALNTQAQNQPVYAGLSNDEQLSLVGMMMADLLERFGSPRSVITERGNEAWQDDVVFQYNGADFYIYRDRIWQIKIASTHGVSNGDRRTAVLQVLGNGAQDRGDHLLLPITGKNWPLMIRVNFSNSGNTGQVTAIYIYRPDF